MSSVSATERVKLWSRFAAPINQDTVKAEFFRKVHSKNPPFRFKIKSTVKERVQIPPMVQYHYKNPPSLLPTLRDVLRCEVIHKQGQSHELIHKDLNKMIDDDLKAIQEANRISDEFEDNKDNILCSEDKLEVSADEKDHSAPEIKQEDILEEDIEMNHVDDELKCLDMPLIKLLAFQRLQQIVNDNPHIVEKYQHESTSVAIRDALCRNPPKRNIPLPSQLLTKADIERIAREFTSPQKDGHLVGSSGDSGSDCGGGNGNHDYDSKDNVINSLNCLNSKIPKLEPMHYANGVDECRSDEEKAMEVAVRLEMPIKHSKIRARAVLVPVSDMLSGKR